MKIPLWLKILISVICIAAVAVIMQRGDETPEYTAEGVEREAEEVVDGFEFDPEELSYDGNGDLDLLQGVSLPGFSRQELRELTFVSIETAGALSKKRVEYTAEKDGVRYRSLRYLHLSGYTGPKITMPQHIPDVKENMIERFGSLLEGEEDFKVDDGFGNDVSAHMKVEAERSTFDSSLVHYTVSIENVFGDRDRVIQDVVLSGEIPVIVLTMPEVRISVGQSFDSHDYIARAENADHSSAIDAVLVEGAVNTSQAGEYTLTYNLYGESVSLRVIVE
jgi:hypothetical protein